MIGNITRSVNTINHNEEDLATIKPAFVHVNQSTATSNSIEWARFHQPYHRNELFATKREITGADTKSKAEQGSGGPVLERERARLAQNYTDVTANESKHQVGGDEEFVDCVEFNDNEIFPVNNTDTADSFSDCISSLDGDLSFTSLQVEPPEQGQVHNLIRKFEVVGAESGVGDNDWFDGSKHGSVASEIVNGGQRLTPSVLMRMSKGQDSFGNRMEFLQRSSRTPDYSAFLQQQTGGYQYIAAETTEDHFDNTATNVSNVDVYAVCQYELQAQNMQRQLSQLSTSLALQDSSSLSSSSESGSSAIRNFSARGIFANLQRSWSNYFQRSASRLQERQDNSAANDHDTLLDQIRQSDQFILSQEVPRRRRYPFQSSEASVRAMQQSCADEENSLSMTPTDHNQNEEVAVAETLISDAELEAIQRIEDQGKVMQEQVAELQNLSYVMTDTPSSSDDESSSARSQNYYLGFMGFQQTWSRVFHRKTSKLEQEACAKAKANDNFIADIRDVDDFLRSQPMHRPRRRSNRPHQLLDGNTSSEVMGIDDNVQEGTYSGDKLFDRSNLEITNDELAETKGLLDAVFKQAVEEFEALTQESNTMPSGDFNNLNGIPILESNNEEKYEGHCSFSKGPEEMPDEEMKMNEDDLQLQRDLETEWQAAIAPNFTPFQSLVQTSPDQSDHLAVQLRRELEHTSNMMGHNNSGGGSTNNRPRLHASPHLMMTDDNITVNRSRDEIGDFVQTSSCSQIGSPSTSSVRWSCIFSHRTPRFLCGKKSPLFRFRC